LCLRDHRERCSVPLPAFRLLRQQVNWRLARELPVGRKAKQLVQLPGAFSRGSSVEVRSVPVTPKQRLGRFAGSLKCTVQVGFKPTRPTLIRLCEIALALNKLEPLGLSII